MRANVFTISKQFIYYLATFNWMGNDFLSEQYFIILTNNHWQCFLTGLSLWAMFVVSFSNNTGNGIKPQPLQLQFWNRILWHVTKKMEAPESLDKKKFSCLNSFSLFVRNFAVLQLNYPVWKTRMFCVAPVHKKPTNHTIKKPNGHHIDKISHSAHYVGAT